MDIVLELIHGKTPVVQVKKLMWMNLWRGKLRQPQGSLHLCFPLRTYLLPMYPLYGTTTPLEHNNTIYMGDMMENSLANPLQSDNNGIQINIRSNKYYGDSSGAHTITLPYGTIIPILYDGVLPYISVWHPTPEEIESCLCAALTPRTVDTHSYLVLFLNALAPIFLVISVQLNSATSTIPLLCLIWYHLKCQWSDWLSWWSPHLYYIRKVLTKLPSMHLCHQLMQNRVIKSCRSDWVRFGILGLRLPSAPIKTLQTIISGLLVY